MSISRDPYDLVVIGGGIAGSTTALCASRAGLRTLVVEQSTHPRFAIGESTVPATTLGYEYLARTYGVPELSHIVHYIGLKKINAAAYPKQSFWFCNHTAGEPLDPREELMLETLQLPMGPDVHMLRADTDAYLVRALPNYGVHYVDQTRVVAYEGPAQRSRDLARVTVEGPDGPRDIEARLVVDASGHASYFAKTFDLRDSPPNLHTHTRSIFGHFENVPLLEDVVPQNPAFRFRRDGGTVHHCFEGGWFWVIPFDNGVCSVGLLLDPRVHPEDASLTPEQELMAFVRKFPTVQQQLGGMRPVRKIIRTGRVQFTSRTILGDGFVLTPHAAGFIDPLFSTGITLTMSFICKLIPLAKRAMRRPQIDMELFRPLETAFQQEVATVDQVVSGTIKSFGHYETFKQYWRTWVYSTVTHYLSMMVCDRGDPHAPVLVYGARFAHWRAALQRMHDIVHAEPRPNDETARALKAVMDALPHPHAAADYRVGAPQACNVAIHDPVHFFRWLRHVVLTTPELVPYRNPLYLAGWMMRFYARMVAQAVRYPLSRLAGTYYHRAVRAIRNLRLKPAAE